VVVVVVDDVVVVVELVAVVDVVELDEVVVVDAIVVVVGSDDPVQAAAIKDSTATAIAMRDMPVPPGFLRSKTLHRQGSWPP
jgi:hypothetical protein